MLEQNSEVIEICPEDGVHARGPYLMWPMVGMAIADSLFDIFRASEYL